MINIGNNPITAAYIGSDGVSAIYIGTEKVFPSSSERVFPFVIVDDLTGYSDRTYEDLYDIATMQWYKLNSDGDYEEYGKYGKSRTEDPYYTGKLVIEGGTEYEWDGTEWVNVGNVSIVEEWVPVTTGMDYECYDAPFTKFRVARTLRGTLTFSTQPCPDYNNDVTHFKPSAPSYIGYQTGEEYSIVDNNGIAYLSDGNHYLEAYGMEIFAQSQIPPVEYEEKDRPVLARTYETLAAAYADTNAGLNQVAVLPDKSAYTITGSGCVPLASYKVLAGLRLTSECMYYPSSSDKTFDQSWKDIWDYDVLWAKIDDVNRFTAGPFYEERQMQYLSISDKLTTAPDGNVFYETPYSLYEITVDPENTVIDSRNGCNAIIETATNKLILGCKNTVIPSDVVSINTNAFRYCVNLHSVTIPSSVTRIEYGAFNNCTGLTSITIPSGVTRIDYGAFQNCTGLTSVTCLATTPPTLGTNAFDNTNNCPIYVPAESVNAYKAASGWSSYASRIQAIPSE